MSILEAAKAETVLEAAIAYASMNISVIPVRGKEPATAWGRHQTKRPSMSLIHSWHHHGQLSGVGIVCGRVSGNLVVVDLDGTEAITAYRERFPHLLDTFTVRTGSGVGQHLYYYTDLPQDTARATGIEGIGNVELRSDGCYVVAPPSVHPKTDEPYGVERQADIMRVGLLVEVERWIIGLVREKRRKAVKTVPNPINPARQGNPSAYARAGLRNQIDRLRTATRGNRNNALNFAAYCLGRLLANPASGLTRHEVEAELTQAAAAIGLMGSDRDEMQTRRTIRSGLEAGLKAPQGIPQRKR